MVKESATGRQTVYYKGKYVGRVSKGTRSEQIKAEQVAKKRRSKETVQIEVFLPKGKGKKERTIPEKYQEAAKVQPEIKGEKISKVSILVKSTINFANYMNDAAMAGKISPEKAQEKFEEYKAATSDAERSKLWETLHDDLKAAGYPDSG